MCVCMNMAADSLAASPARGGRRLVLASTSPRRRKLLASEGLEFRVAEPGFDDAHVPKGQVGAAQWVASLAYFKASAAVRALSSSSTKSVSHEGGSDYATVIGADTLVVKDGAMLGKPATAADAERMIRALADGEHEVVTGVALVDTKTGERDVFVDKAVVRLGALSDEQIATYVASGAWRGKAGGYNLEERIADGWPLTYEGDPTTVVGLPMRKLLPKLSLFTSRM